MRQTPGPASSRSRGARPSCLARSREPPPGGRHDQHCEMPVTGHYLGQPPQLVPREGGGSLQRTGLRGLAFFPSSTLPWRRRFLSPQALEQLFGHQVNLEAGAGLEPARYRLMRPTLYQLSYPALWWRIELLTRLQGRRPAPERMRAGRRNARCILSFSHCTTPATSSSVCSALLAD